MSKTITREEVARHNTPADCWIVIDGDVYDVTKFIKFHPGGAGVIEMYAGKEATEPFYDLHRTEVLHKYARFKIGRLADAEGTPAVNQIMSTEFDQVPYGEPAYYQGFKSPYLTESHARFKKAVRAFLNEHIRPEAEECERTGKTPSREIMLKMGMSGLLGCQLGPGPHLVMMVAAGINILGGVAPEEFDYFHNQICYEELVRMGTLSFTDGMVAGFNIGAPPVLIFAKQEVAMKHAPAILRGEKNVCLAITEPFAGSDVANIKCTAVKSPCGKFYIVNGVKKWITSGMLADCFVTAVRTGGNGMGGISVLLIERGEGVDTSPIKTAYSSSAGTAYITFTNVKVPVENLLGKENKGFQPIMANFNHERWMISAHTIAACRYILSESLRYSHQRKVFGKRLIDQPVIREKVARMISGVEAAANWMDSLTYQMCNMKYEEQNMKLAGPISLHKFFTTRMAHDMADEASQIFGGRAITQSGMGRNVELFIRTIKYPEILGGAASIMADLGVKQTMKRMPPNARL